VELYSIAHVPLPEGLETHDEAVSLRKDVMLLTGTTIARCVTGRSRDSKVQRTTMPWP
jgi:hypothetical protein